MDADGTYTGNNITFTTTSQAFAKEFLQFLYEQKISPTLYERGDGTYQVYVPHEYHNSYKAIAICQHPEKKEAFQALKKGTPRKPRAFIDFNKDTLLAGYFDFRRLEGLYILGLGEVIKALRKKKELKKKQLISRVKLSLKTLAEIEKNNTAISLPTLERILALSTETPDLMPFLEHHHSRIKFRKGRSCPLLLDCKPNEQLRALAKKMLFYKSLIRINSTHFSSFQELLKKKFQLVIKDQTISHKLLRDYFETFCRLAPK